MLNSRSTGVTPCVCMLGQVKEPLREAVSTGIAGLIKEREHVYTTH